MLKGGDHPTFLLTFTKDRIRRHRRFLLYWRFLNKGAYHKNEIFRVISVCHCKKSSVYKLNASFPGKA